jgi:hypothetical protein
VTPGSCSRGNEWDTVVLPVLCLSRVSSGVFSNITKFEVGGRPRSADLSPILGSYKGTQYDIHIYQHRANEHPEIGTVVSPSMYGSSTKTALGQMSDKAWRGNAGEYSISKRGCIGQRLNGTCLSQHTRSRVSFVFLNIGFSSAPSCRPYDFSSPNETCTIRKICGSTRFDQVTRESSYSLFLETAPVVGL